MTNQELLSAFSVMLDERLHPIIVNSKKIEYCMEHLDERMEHLESQMEQFDERVEHLEGQIKHLQDRADHLEEGMKDLRCRMSIFEEDMCKVKQSVHRLELQGENEVMPRLKTIEACYTSTFVRYKDGVVQMEVLQTDVDVLKRVVSEHSLKLQNIS